jgi:ribulose-5-phosphate 4-epimerase/fuculose-1-phosphate aldolase
MVRLNAISKVSSVEELLRREKEHMAAAFRIFAKMGFADGASGHISLRGI